MVLSDVDLTAALKNKSITISNIDPNMMRSASYCLRLAPDLHLNEKTFDLVDLSNSETFPIPVKQLMTEEQGYVLNPGQFMLGKSIETLSIDTAHSANLSNISGLARLGLQSLLSTHVSPGFGNSSPKHIVFEIYNVSNLPIRLFPNMRMAHIVFHSLVSPSSHGYDNKFGTKYGDSVRSEY